MDTPTSVDEHPGAAVTTTNGMDQACCARRESLSQRSQESQDSQDSQDSQTAADFIRDQMQLEADAREALPYSIRDCTKELGPLRQSVFACLTCNPPPTEDDGAYNPAGVCYSCSVQCHGEHELVEIFQKRNFTCDCGTTRFKSGQPCTLRINPDTNTRGGVHSEPADPNNKYNQNFRNRFCACAVDYKPTEQQGTMFQCLGLGTHEDGGCGEDWYHPGCLIGLGPHWCDRMEAKPAGSVRPATNGTVLTSIVEDDGAELELATEQAAADTEVEDDVPLPEGFPAEDAFDHFICYKCVEAHPWIKRYAGTPGFLPPLFLQTASETVDKTAAIDMASPKKRKMDDNVADEITGSEAKRIKSDLSEASAQAAPATEVQKPLNTNSENNLDVKLPEKKSSCKYESLPPAAKGLMSLFVGPSFYDGFCRCSSCFPRLRPHPQLLEEEEAYEPPLSEDGSEAGSTAASGSSLLERGESALMNVDRARAIEGLMAYRKLKDQLNPFFKRHAESGQAISAEDIKEYFAQLRGDQEAIKAAGETAKGDHRREQSGY